MSFVLQNGWSPLNAASRNGHLDVVGTLLEAGANINHKDGRTSLDVAVERGHNETIQLLKTYQTKADEKAKRADKRANQELLETKQHYDALQQQIRLLEERATRAEQGLLEIKWQRDAMQQQTRLQVQNADERARRAEDRASTVEKEHLETKQQEMHMAASVRHPNLLLFIGASLDDNKPVILTELMPKNLRSIIVTLPQDHVITIGMDVARGLNYLHLMRLDPIIHRDVSSANVLLEPIGSGNWKAKVSDYGSANFLSKVITMGPGNASYVAPESSNPKLQSPKMDVYSYGILLLEMATGQFPDHRLQAMRLDTLPWQEMTLMIRRCICDDPASRQTMKDLLPDLTDLDK
eukprot:Em0040g22a